MEPRETDDVTLVQWDRYGNWKPYITNFALWRKRCRSQNSVDLNPPRTHRWYPFPQAWRAQRLGVRRMKLLPAFCDIVLRQPHSCVPTYRAKHLVKFQLKAQGSEHRKNHFRYSGWNIFSIVSSFATTSFQGSEFGKKPLLTLPTDHRPLALPSNLVIRSRSETVFTVGVAVGRRV